MKTKSFSYSLLTVFLRAALVAALFVSGWLIYSKLPHEDSPSLKANNDQTRLQIVLRPPANGDSAPLDISVELYPVDIVAARHEFFTERRAGKRFDDFLNERMKVRAPVSAKLDKQGGTSVVVSPGSWWLHAQLAGEENLEWRLQLDVAGPTQTVELTTENIYTRTKSF
ncbi:MAG TPA: hypothetical protein VGO56_00775 [Pyrinomonadaceae bacterium]|nr:hypothetical protein [Pyrinomonadaceae bacterium]